MEGKAVVRSEDLPAYGDSLLPGWYTREARPHFIGSRCAKCGTYYFPKVTGFCRNPACDGEQFEEVQLSRTGKLWSYTSAHYQPPEPYVSAQPFKPFAIAAVRLVKEQMIVLGAVVDGVGVDALKAGAEMELVLERLAD